MTHKEVQQQLRILAQAPALKAEDRNMLDHIADKYDPPRPEPGTVVWWRTDRFANWQLGEVWGGGVQAFGDSAVIRWHAIEWKPARILRPDEVAVKVPPVREWPEGATRLNVTLSFHGNQPDYAFPVLVEHRVTSTKITRTEAERREADR